MTWWRRDPFFLSHSPIYRYAQRILRDRETTLRSRCYSRTPSTSAQHEDDRGKKRPSNMTNLEWMQLQHYERWRKRLLEDPYKTLFGASNDMLIGKGLKDWEWVHKSFPKWMLQEMNMDEKPQEALRDKSLQTPYPKKVEIKGDKPTKVRESLFPQPGFRSARFERDESTGIVSPSDSRRPRESSHVKVVGNSPSEIRAKIQSSSAAPSTASTIFVPPLSESRGDIDVASDEFHKQAIQDVVKSTRQEAAAREASFIDEFLNTKAEHHKSIYAGNAVVSWRQTALQRRAASELTRTLRPKPASLENTPINNTLSASSAALAHESTPSEYSMAPEHKSRDWLIQQETPQLPKETQKRAVAPRSTSRILSQLPEDDLDFISAADIRASMGAKRSRLPTDEQRQQARGHLEKMFADTEIPKIDSMVESNIINDQYVRRTARELGHSESTPEIAHEATMTKAAVAPSSETTVMKPEEKQATRTTATEAPRESSMDRIKKYLDGFAKQFWQDPTEEADVTKTRLFFDKAAHYLKKGQATMLQVAEDLEKDVPASKTLLKRLKKDNEVLDVAINRLRQRSFNGRTQDLSPRKVRAIESLKMRFQQADIEMKKAYTTLDELAGTDAVANATRSFKRRLVVSSKVLHSNAQLLRMLIWSLQARFEDPKISRDILANYKVVADNLLSLRDTQMNLMRLVDRAMLIYGVTPESAKHSETYSGKLETPEHDACEEPFVRARLAADAHLINEIKAHKSPILEPSVDGESSMAKPKSNKVLDESSPLANSLFRPFAPAFERLGTTKASNLAAEKAKEDERKKLSDLQLVANVKKAYEDTYGAITIDHRQVAPELENVKTGDDTAATAFTMLKEDPTAYGRSLENDSQAIPEDKFMAAGRSLGYEMKATPEEDTLLSSSAAEVKSGAGASDVEASTSTPANTTTSKEVASSPDEVKTSSATSTTTINSATPGPSTDLPEHTSSLSNMSTHYTILVRDPQTDTLSITTSTTGPPRDILPAMPLHQALSALDSPAKFIPYISSGLEVVSAKTDILVLRDAIDSSASTRGFETVRTSAYEDYHSVNPIDGTARLSPTGYVGPEESPEQLEKEFEERRQAAGKVNNKGNEREEKTKEKGKRRRGAGGVVKTAIWVAGMCYVVGVVGEVAT